MNKSMLKVTKWFLLSIGMVSILASVSIIRVSAIGGWAQCGGDSYIECAGGVRCTTEDQVGCACYDSGGNIVDQHSCSEAADGGPIFVPEAGGQY